MRDWLRVDEAAAWLRITPGAVRVVAHRKRWRTTRDGRRTLYHLDDVGAEVERRGAVQGR